jgi:hypothetical protein
LLQAVTETVISHSEIPLRTIQLSVSGSDYLKYFGNLKKTKELPGIWSPSKQKVGIQQKTLESAGDGA